MTNPTDLEKRTLSIKRTFNAPRQFVWDAWTQAEHIAQWWGPPGMNTKVVKHDFQVGGEWEYVMTMPDGSDFISHGVYSKIEAPTLLETSADFKPMTEGVTLQVILEEEDGKTNFTFNVIHPTEAYAKQQFDMGFMNGWGATFERLAQFLAA